jgi:2'-5' RNA ligase
MERQTLRLFFAFALSDEIRAYAARLQGFLRREGVRGKWCAPENLHLTLLFVGDVEPERLYLLQTTADACCRTWSPLRLRTVGLESFRRNPRLVYLAFEQERCGAFSDWSRDLRETLTAAGVAIRPGPEASPHATLVRFRGGHETRTLRRLRSSDGTWAVDLPEPEANEKGMVLTDLHLVRSELRPQGPVYNTVTTSRLDLESSGTKTDPRSA